MVMRPGRWWNLLRVSVSLALLAVLVLTGMPRSSQAAAAEDFGIQDGWFFGQTRGQGEPGTGYAVIDTANIGFYSTFNALGGVASLGYPVSHRFTWDGAVVQAFQRGALEWRPESGVQVVNVMDKLSAGGFDSWLSDAYAVPAPAGGASLGDNPVIAKAYSSVPNAAAVLGAPVAYQDFGPLATLRTERGAISQWKVETNFAPVGGVTIPNTGDMLSAAGIIPADAAKAQQASYVYGYGGYYPYSPVPAPRPANYYPYYPYYAPSVQSAPYYPYGYNYGTYYPWYQGNAYPYSYPYFNYAPYAPSPNPYYQPYYGYNPYPAYGYGQPYYGPLPQRAVCLGDEQMSFNPGRPGTNQQFQIDVTTARQQQQFELRGPGGPQFIGARPGGKGIVYSWVARIGNNGRYNFDFVVTSGTVCTANVVDIG